MSVLLQFAMFPTDKGESVSPYVTRLVRLLDESGADYRLGAMGTVVETEDLEGALRVLADAYRELEPDCARVYAVASFDVRKGPTGRLRAKVDSVEEKLGRPPRT